MIKKTWELLPKFTVLHAQDESRNIRYYYNPTQSETDFILIGPFDVEY